MNWHQFKLAAPELAAAAEDLFDQHGFVYIGTIRKDGSPRISPLHVFIVEGVLHLSMMWYSLKASDLLRDRRCTIHTSINDPLSGEVEFKLHGCAILVEDASDRNAVYAKVGWTPGPWRTHLFGVDIQSAGLFVTEGTDRIVKRWRAADQVRVFRVQDMEGRLVPIP